MKTDLSENEANFVPDYVGWENDFDEQCRSRRTITVKLESPDLPAGVEQAIHERARKNGLELEMHSPKILVFKNKRQLL